VAWVNRYGPTKGKPPPFSRSVPVGGKIQVISLARIMHETPLPKPGTGGRDGLRRKAHPEPLPSLDDRTDPQAFHHNPAQRPGLALHHHAATMRLCRADLPATAHSSRLKAAPTAFLLTEPTARREGRPDPRSRQVVRA